ncbi:disks large-associated protein 2 isoform X1 [Sebastes umbrosus]|uniref:disks large-associated protein 2 isoform X1 n=2 Tax=Sebastes umbrosus TaxID=72105 RepID=UPI00189C6B9A|nr:disks large-associated protein 2 isoform X1 [Sebastes umbrosus]XP_037652531.1 disks large-associated protein 2 isoform X1 [Sebastes umbrosus]
MSALKKVLPGILKKHCCILPDRNTGVKRLLMKLKSREIYSDQQYSWSPSQYFDEDSYSPPPRNMKGLSGGRPAQLQLTSAPSAHTCGLVECDHSLDHHLHHGNSRPPSYLLSPTESCPLESHHRCSPRSSIHSECMVIPVSMSATDHSISSSTFPRMHYGSAGRDSGGNTSGGRESRDDGGSSSHGGSGKMNRIPANLLDQFEKQMPLHRDGFHTLQYQRTSTTTTTTEQRNESPGRIRHLVHSVQKLFTKSHSLEGSSKMNGTKGDSHRDGSHHHHHHHQGHHKHSKRSKSKERKSEGSGKQRSGGWWSSDDNLDSDSTYRTPSVMSRHPVDHISHCYPDSMHGHLAGDLSLKTSKSNNDVKCSACESISMAPEGKFMKRSSWSTLTVSQAKEAYRKSSLNLEKPMTPTDLKPNVRPCHYLQVPQDDWGGYPGGGKDDEIPCRRMRSSSYVKAMGDEESGESDSSPKTSPQKMVRPDALVKAIIRPRDLLDSQSSYRLDKINSDMRNYITNFAADLSQSYHMQAARDMHPSIALDPSANYNSPKFRSRNQSYMRAVSTLSQASCVSQVSQVSETEINGQFESVCESVFSEVESQAMEALDLPGCFRTRSHSYLRAIQAGYSQDDDCIPPMASTVTSTIRATTGIQFCLPSTCSIDRTPQQTPAITYTPNYKKAPPPVPPRTTSKPLISITAQSSTESTQDAYHDGRHPHGGMWAPDGLSMGLNPCRALYNSTDSLDSAKAVTIAMEAAGVMAGKRHPSTDSHSSVLTCDKAILVSKAEEYLKTPRSSIGIQVEAATDSESESKGLREYHSVGIQVEDTNKGQGRFKRSNSVTAGVQADMELEGFPTMEDKGLQFGGGFQRHSEPSTPTQYGAVRTVRTQGLFSYREDYRTPTEPPSPRETTSETTWQLEPPSPRENAVSSGESGRASPSLRRDGSWFMQLLHTETKRIEGWCKEMEAEAEENDLSEETLGKIRSAVGSAQLLMSQKFQQFYWLCQQNLDPSAMPRPTSQDLAGFWDLLQLSIEDVTMKFDQLQQIKDNNWRPVDSPEKKPPAPVPKKTIRQRSLVTRERSLDLPDRGRQEARRRLMAAKRAASFRQNSASERADSIEIYIPEAQTRL